MKNIYDEIGLPSKKYYKKIAKLVEPIETYLGINRFWRNFHRKNGFYSVLGNHPPIAEAFFGQNLYIGHPYFRNPRFFQSGFNLPELSASVEYENTQGRLRREGECHNVLICIQKNEDGFIEYGFATSMPLPSFGNIYLNHLQDIRRFINSFERNAATLIQEANEYKINIASLVGIKYHEKPQLSEDILVSDKKIRFLSAIEGDLNKERQLLSLTENEKLSLRNYLLGNTMQEIAQKLQRSPRTIEKHLENAKSKLDVHSRSELFEALAPFFEVL